MAKNTHDRTSKIAINLTRGEYSTCPFPSKGVAVIEIDTGIGVVVAVEVVVYAGKIKVIAGKGRRVVVGVIVGVEEGVGVSVGKLVAFIVVWEVLLAVEVTVVTYETAAFTGCEAKIMHTIIRKPIGEQIILLVLKMYFSLNI